MGVPIRFFGPYALYAQAVRACGEIAEIVSKTTLFPLGFALTLLLGESFGIPISSCSSMWFQISY